jgi:hypothetical protein
MGKALRSWVLGRLVVNRQILPIFGCYGLGLLSWYWNQVEQEVLVSARERTETFFSLVQPTRENSTLNARVSHLLGDIGSNTNGLQLGTARASCSLLLRFLRGSGQKQKNI